MFNTDTKENIVQYTLLEFFFFTLINQFVSIRIFMSFNVRVHLLGLLNTAGVLAAVFGTAATGFIIQQGLRVSLFILEFTFILQFVSWFSIICDLLLQVIGMMFSRLLLHCA